MIAIVFLLISIILSSNRNLLSKIISSIKFGERSFFIYQAVIFLFGAFSICVFGKIQLKSTSNITLILAIFYGLSLILAQWFYTISLSVGNTAICSTVYSLGFILPIVFGVIFWSEELSLYDVLGIIFAVAALFLSGNKTVSKAKSKYYFIPLLISMLASGGLGIMQKLQQNSDFPHQKGNFLFIAFLIASTISFISSLFSKSKNKTKSSSKSIIFSCVIGLCFGCCNLLNTHLAGVLPSSFFFPVLNISIIMLTMSISRILFKERIGKRGLLVLACGITSIIMLSIL